MMGYFFFVLRKVSHEPDGLVLDFFGITVSEEKLFSDEFFIIFRACVGGLIIGEEFWWSFGVEESLNFKSIGLIVHDGVLNDGKNYINFVLIDIEWVRNACSHPLVLSGELLWHPTQIIYKKVILLCRKMDLNKSIWLIWMLNLDEINDEIMG